MLGVLVLSVKLGIWLVAMSVWSLMIPYSRMSGSGFGFHESRMDVGVMLRIVTSLTRSGGIGSSASFVLISILVGSLTLPLKVIWPVVVIVGI